VSPNLDLVVPNQFQLTYGRRFSLRLHQNPAFVGRGAQEDAAILFVGV